MRKLNRPKVTIHTALQSRAQNRPSALVHYSMMLIIDIQSLVFEVSLLSIGLSTSNYSREKYIGFLTLSLLLLFNRGKEILYAVNSQDLCSVDSRMLVGLGSLSTSCHTREGTGVFGSIVIYILWPLILPFALLGRHLQGPESCKCYYRREDQIRVICTSVR